jgi:DNA-3-methyladenine glycosylase
VAEPDGTPGGILIRALEPLSGLAVMQRRRPKARRVEDLASGPGKLALAMGVTRKLNRADLVKGPLTVRGLLEEEAFETIVGPRIGITHCADLPLRFCIAGNRFVSR